jgi:acyl-CoA synthetase (NDP forming)
MDEQIGRKPISADGERLPNYAFPENAARVMGKLANYSDGRSQPEGMIPEFNDIDPGAARTICRSASSKQESGWLSAEDARRVLAALALPLPGGGFCRTADEAARVASELGFPVAVKLASRQIVHKTEVGGVSLNLQDETAVREAFMEIRNRLAQAGNLDAMDGVLVQPMISGGVELMIGVTQDPSFGPLIGFGLGGIYVEILKDVCFRITPITDRDAKEMVRSIKGYRLLEGYRGHPSADIEAIEDLLLRVSRLVEEVPEIAEMDLNPVMALPPGHGCLIVDARIRVEL